MNGHLDTTRRSARWPGFLCAAWMLASLLASCTSGAKSQRLPKPQKTGGSMARFAPVGDHAPRFAAMAGSRKTASTPERTPVKQQGFWSRFVPPQDAVPHPDKTSADQPVARLTVTLKADGRFAEDRNDPPAPAETLNGSASAEIPSFGPELALEDPASERAEQPLPGPAPLAAEPGEDVEVREVAEPPAHTPRASSETPKRTAPTAAAPPEEAFRYKVKPGDTLSISIPYEADTTRTVPVQPDGYIRYLFDTEVLAAGKTYREIHDGLLKQLKRYYKNPRVTVIGTSFQGNSVFIMGPVTKPGPHVIHRGTRLLDVLASAGVLALLPESQDLYTSSGRQREIVDLSGAYVARDDKILEVDFEKLLLEKEFENHNIALKPGDFIFIPSSLTSEKKIYIVGRVGAPQVYYYTGRLTFMEAMLEAGGADTDVGSRNNNTSNDTAMAKQVFIVRKEAKEPIEVNWPAIQRGNKPDFALRSGDIIYVPERPLSYWSRATTNVISEIMAPLKAVLQLDNTTKDYYRHDWEFRK